MDWMNDVIAPKAAAIAKNPWIAAVQDTMIATVPVILISSFITMISLISQFTDNFPDLSFFSNFTMGLSALMVAYLVPTFVLEKKQLSKYSKQAGFMSAALFMAMSGASFAEGEFSLASDRIGASGMFVAIAAGLLTSLVMVLFSEKSMFSKESKMPQFLIDSFDSVAPIMVVMIFAYVTCGLLKLDLYAWISALVSPLVNIAQSLFGMTFIMFLMAFFYSFGISPWLLNPVYYTVGLDAISKNAQAVAAGQRASLVLTNETLGGFIFLGGTGCTLTLCLLLLFCKSEKLKGLGKTCIVPGIFNINEPVVYGCVAFNPLLMIPMWLNPTIVSIITYLCMKAGIVSPPYSSFMLWYVPIPIQTYLTNSDFRGVILVLILLVITAIIWYPFVAAYDRQCLAEEKDK